MLFYTDSGSEFIDSPEHHICLMAERNQDVVVFSSGLRERRYSKPDALLLMDCHDGNNCSNTMQRMSGAAMFRKSIFSLTFTSAWMTYNNDERIVSEANEDEMKAAALSIANKHLPLASINEEIFKVNRHDQTVLSIISKRFKIPEWPDPSQFGEKGYNGKLRRREEFKSIKKSILSVTRDKN